ncbi:MULTISPECIES: hypothetical protein [Acinetobacter]|uniref:hypothetical protein n=1 Tax=Acinetobacter TaxID=469 RepID=UPI0007B3FB5E|nr:MULTISPECIES: hypothetical protein [Acinetobacter]MCU4440013.1 hypothetical protein [Acinetobacter lwoffii]PSD34719.1 hypothetical protein C7E16_13765 [Acinetobacter radioresistens]PSD36069.1 hypothetical protein C7E21_13190 [Acinetobacter radioresistens]ULG20705.1 hypothetical protein ANMEGGLA_00279 [Acinetobacter nosocomialis]HDG9824208.1 hypothetical protein [Acinetobacter nosocomialis]
MQNKQGITVAEAKNTFENGNVKALRADYLLGDLYLVVCMAQTGEKTIITHRGHNKAYKSMNALFADYKTITSQQVKTLALK